MAPLNPPNALAREDPPSLPDLLGTSDWVAWNLQKALTQPNILENKTYGPMNSFLACLFPLRRRYSIGPQAAFEAKMQIGIRADISNVSTGSTGGQHKSRSPTAERKQKNKKLPDFSVVKVITTGIGKRRQNYVVCIIEMKCDRDWGSGDTTARQMTSYMLRVASATEYHDAVLNGYIVFADECCYDHWVATKEGGVWTAVVSRQAIPIFDGDAPLAEALGQLSIKHWNKDNVTVQ